MCVTLAFLIELGKFLCIKDLLTIQATIGDNILGNFVMIQMVQVLIYLGHDNCGDVMRSNW